MPTVGVAYLASFPAIKKRSKESIHLQDEWVYYIAARKNSADTANAA